MSVPVFAGRVSEVTRRLRAAAVVVASPFTLQQQVQDWGGRAWEFDITLAPHVGADARRLSAFFDMIAPRRAFLFSDPTLVQSVIGVPVVDGAGQTGTTLALSGFLPNFPALYAGDFLSLGTGLDTRLYRVTADAQADATGRAVLQIVPPLRSSPANGATVNVTAPQVLLRLTDEVPSSIGAARIHRFAFSAVEAL